MSTSDYSDLLGLFESLEVRYLVIGGYAVMVYAEPRFTKDLDIWVDPTPENANKVFAALARFGAPLGECVVDDFTSPGVVFQIGVAPVRIDILTGITGVVFGDAWRKRERHPFLGGSVWFISREHLIRNKQASGRPRDLIDIEELQLAARLRPDLPESAK